MSNDIIVTKCPFCHMDNKTLCFDKDKRIFNCASCNATGNEKALNLASQMFFQLKLESKNKEKLQ